MSAKTYCKKTAAFAGYLIQNIPADLTEETMDSWMNNPEVMKKFLSGLRPEVAPVKPQSLFTVIATTSLGALDEKPTKECFPKPRYVYRDNDFDNWLHANQPKTDDCVISTLAFTKGWTFVEAAAKVLGIGADSGIKTLGKALIENCYTMTLAQAERMVDKTERGDKTEMHTNGYGNFFFVETGNEDDPVSVGFVDRGGGDWCAHIYSLDFGLRWVADFRLLVRNLDASKL